MHLKLVYMSRRGNLKPTHAHNLHDFGNQLIGKLTYVISRFESLIQRTRKIEARTHVSAHPRSNSNALTGILSEESALDDVWYNTHSLPL